MAAACLVVPLTALAVAGVHEVRSAAARASDRQVARAVLDDRYYACLRAQARSLVRPGQVVKVSRARPGNWATLSKAVAGWAVMTQHADQAVAVLSLRSRHGPDACLGSVVVARYHDGAVRAGHGASLPGAGPPPAQPL